GSFAILGAQQAAFLRRFAGIMRRQQRLVMFVPLVHEIEPTLLHPSFEIFLADLVGIVEQIAIGRENLDRRFFHRHALTAEFAIVGRYGAWWEIRCCCAQLETRGTARERASRK